MNRQVSTFHYLAQRGFTLVEIMVSLAITSIITAGVVHVYATSASTDHLNKGLSYLQENARGALILLENDIRMANYQGCSDPYMNFINTTDNTLQANNAPLDDLFEDGLQGFEVTPTTVGTWAAGTEFEDLHNEAKANSDVIHVMFASTVATDVTADMATANSAIQVGENPNNIREGELLLISSCSDATLFRATDVSTAEPITLAHTQGVGDDENTSSAFNEPFGADAQIHRFNSNTFYVADNSAGIPSLYRRDVNGNKTELVEGVENMQILYGQRDTNETETNLSDDLVRFVSADDNSLNMEQVDRIQVSFLVRSNAEILTKKGPTIFEVLGEDVTIATADKQLRRVFTTTIQLHNRKPHSLEE